MISTESTERLVSLVVFGEFNRGKSTLVNAILGRVVLLAKLVPTTGHVTTVLWGEEERVRVQFADFTGLGIAELTRSKKGKSLIDNQNIQ